jgi:hypothetical protein
MSPARHGCHFCVALQHFAIRRRDPALIDAAIRLRAEHAANDAERATFARANARQGAPEAHPAETAPTNDRVTLLIGEWSDPAIDVRFRRKA